MAMKIHKFWKVLVVQNRLQTMKIHDSGCVQCVLGSDRVKWGRPVCLGFGPLGNVMQRPYLFVCFSLLLETLFGHFFWDSLRTPFGDPFWGALLGPPGQLYFAVFCCGETHPRQCLAADFCGYILIVRACSESAFESLFRLVISGYRILS